MSFHHPYHFSPVRKVNPAQTIAVEDFLSAGALAVTHDRYVPGRHTGRLLCRITTIDPVVVGKKTDPKPSAQNPGTVLPFELSDRPAIPASSLRGLISSLAEAASNSALRALEDQRIYSYRNLMGQGLSAIGLYSHKLGEGHFLRPLCLPTLREENGEFRMKKAVAQKLFPEPVLKAYIGDKKSIRETSFSRYATYRDDTRVVWYAKLPRGEWEYHGDWAVLKSESNWHRTGKRDEFLLSQTIPEHKMPILAEDVPEADTESYIGGFIRTLGAFLPDRKAAMPETKKHELFLSMPAKPAKVNIPDHVVERFRDLCIERDAQPKQASDPHLPFAPHGTDRAPSDPGAPVFELKTGDLLYFNFHPQTGEITEISLSSIWRGRVETPQKSAAGAFDFFRSVDPELLPFDKHRTRITIAEQMFGFVEGAMRHESEGPQGPGLALASRVRFSHALLHRFGNESPLEQPYLPPVTLKILDSPKPPSPAFYFRTAQGEGFIAKRNLQPGTHLPQGRKFYLHRHSSQSEPWSTRDAHDQTTQKVSVTPLRPRAELWFHVDFDNLTDQELALLVYALRPNDSFRHKLGMGKPLGLGGVEITPVALLETDRAKRYTLSGFLAPRYTSAKGTAESRPDDYAAEANALANAPPLDLASFQAAARKLNPDLAAIIELLGNPGAVKYPVHTPVVQVRGKQGLEHPEDESFRWFVANEQNGLEDEKARAAQRQPAVRAQFLKPIQPRATVLPVLTPIIVEPKR